MPPLTNATLTGVAGAGAPDDWDRAAAPGGQKWAGSIRAFYTERVERRTNVTDGTATRVTVRTLYVDTRSFDELNLDEDDLLSFTLDGATSPETATAQTVARTNNRALGSVETTRIDLRDQ